MAKKATLFTTRVIEMAQNVCENDFSHVIAFSLPLKIARNLKIMRWLGLTVALIFVTSVTKGSISTIAAEMNMMA